MLKRLANDFAPRRDRQFIAKGNVQIAECDFTAMSIKDRHDKSERMREAEAGFAGEQWDQFCRGVKTGPFQSVTKLFPSPAHRDSIHASDRPRHLALTQSCTLFHQLRLT